MKTCRLIYVVVALLLAPRLALAQDVDPAQYNPQTWWKTGCPTCGLRSAVDWVQTLPLPEGDHIVIAGWGFECVSGKPVDRVDTHAWDPARGAYVPVPTELRWTLINRPDVAASAPGCAVPIGSGFGAVVTGTLPAGATSLKINVWQGPWHTQTTILVLTR